MKMLTDGDWKVIKKTYHHQTTTPALETKSISFPPCLTPLACSWTDFLSPPERRTFTGPWHKAAKVLAKLGFFVSHCNYTSIFLKCFSGCFFQRQLNLSGLSHPDGAPTGCMPLDNTFQTWTKSPIIKSVTELILCLWKKHSCKRM